MKAQQQKALKDAIEQHCGTISEFARRSKLDQWKLRRLVNGKARITIEVATQVARHIHADDTEQQQKLIQRIFPVRAGMDILSHELEVRALQYGHLKIEELNTEVRPGVPFSGPTGLLINLFRRFALQAGKQRLVPCQRRYTLRDAIDSKAYQHAYLGNLATIPRVETDFLFCTPIRIGVQGLIRAEGTVDKDSHTIERIRNALALQDPNARSLIAPIYMTGEIGANVVHAVLGDVRTMVPIDDLRVDDYIQALRTAPIPRSPKRAVLFVDELTCLLALTKCGQMPAALALRDTSKGIRYHFGFSIPRANQELRDWFKRAWDVYIQSDANHIASLYFGLYEELVAFAKSLNKKSRPPDLDHIAAPEEWAAALLGIDSPDVKSTWVDEAWGPIVESVYRKVRRRRAHRMRTNQAQPVTLVRSSSAGLTVDTLD